MRELRRVEGYIKEFWRKYSREEPNAAMPEEAKKGIRRYERIELNALMVGLSEGSWGDVGGAVFAVELSRVSQGRIEV